MSWKDRNIIVSKGFIKAYLLEQEAIFPGLLTLQLSDKFQVTKPHLLRNEQSLKYTFEDRLIYDDVFLKTKAKMKIQYCSDLHLEFPDNKKFLTQQPIEPVGEVLLLAGDILPLALVGKQTDFIDRISSQFEMVYWVPGNHEYYGCDAATVNDPLLEKLRSNVWLVNNQTLSYRDVNFVCTTLWSKITPLNAPDLQRSISDFFAIKWGSKKFTASQFNSLHRSCFSFLENAMKERKSEKNIVVTHHVPTLQHYPAYYRNSPLTEAFAVELYDFIYDCKANYWIYGHHHCNTEPFIIGNTTMLTNQVGYLQYNEQAGFKTTAFIEI